MDNTVYNYFRVGLRWDVFPEKLWPNRTVPYAISPLYEPEDHITIRTAIRTLSMMTCVKFVNWNGKDDDFLLIWPIKYPKVRDLSFEDKIKNYVCRDAGATWAKLEEHKLCPCSHLTQRVLIVWGAKEELCMS